MSNADASKARAIFFAEAREQCERLEAILLAKPGAGDAEICQRLFRTAHTIKGSAGLFGLQTLQQFAHEMESVLERLRQGQIVLDQALVSLLLRCKDHLRSLIDSGEWAQTPDVVEQVQARVLSEALHALCAEGSGAAAAVVGVLEAESGGRLICSANPYWQVGLRFDPALFRKGFDPLLLLNDLSELGELRQVQVVWRDWPALPVLDATECFFGLNLSLASQADATSLGEVFELIQHDACVALLPPRAPLRDYRLWAERLQARAPTQAGESVAAQVQRWQDCGALTAQEAARVMANEVQADTVMLNEDIRTEAQLTQPALPLKAEAAYVRVEAGKLDRLIDRVGELVLALAGTDLLARREGDPLLLQSVGTLQGLVESLREDALTLRMVPLDEVFGRFPRLVREVALQLGKNIRLELAGAQTEIDKTLVEPLTEALTHLVRNALDHGLELPAERLGSGKPAQGVLRIAAWQEAQSVWVEVLDDGRGIAHDKVLARARSLGLVAGDVAELPEGAASDAALMQWIFRPGFSTATQLSALSGRGVGLDVVKRNIEALRGEIDVSSRPKQGSCFRLRLPLTLSLIEGFQVEVSGASYVLPLSAVLACDSYSVQAAAGARGHLLVRDEWLPCVHLRELFGQADTGPSAYAVIVRFGARRVVLVVDRLVGQMQAVIKPLGPLFRALRGISGTTILANGQAALVLDVGQLIQWVEQREARAGGVPFGTLAPASSPFRGEYS
ncbi:chemotaxis protein CheA [Roseateles koreensis]|uniref:Chemotaxis protein CheA n=1 Tax=Roseateles koreensis TaxID=2987526 RepID=A0ABT5KUV7_9BURK|nr:chemotaxis protein CheA [Roseateles koreensis]